MTRLDIRRLGVRHLEIRRLDIKRYILAVFFVALLTGCASTQFAAVAPGLVALGNLNVQAMDAKWNKAPGIMTGHLNKGSELWTRDGLLLDYLLLVPGIGNGGTMFKSQSDSLVYPGYKSGMLPNEIVEFTESSLAKLNGTEVVVTSSGLRPYKAGEPRAVMFDLQLTSAESPRRQGRALAFVKEDELYLLLYVATQLHYFDKHWQTVLATMDSAQTVAGR